MSRRARLCMVVHGAYPIGEPRVAREARVAIDRGYEVDVVAMRRADEPSRELVEGARVFRLPLRHQRGRGPFGVAWEYLAFTALASLRVAVLAGMRRYTHVHVHNPPDFLIVSALIPKLLGARVIFDVHDLSVDMFLMRFGGGRARIVERLLGGIERWAARAADTVLTVHEPYREELSKHGIPARKIVVVMNSLDDSVVGAPGPAGRDPRFRIVYHGTVSPPYGVRVLVEACARLADRIPGVRVEIYGEGDEVESLEALVEELGLSDHVFLSGRYLPHAEVLERVRAASVGVIPNLPTRLNRFALSSKLLEYVALGVPAVCSDLPTLRAHFSDEEVLFFGAGEARSLETALLDVFSDPEGAAERAGAALRRYQDYRWPLHAARYARVLGGRRA